MERMQPTNEPTWTFYKMTKGDYARKGELPRKNGRTIINLVATCSACEGEGAIKNFEINSSDYFRTDQAGLSLEIYTDKGEGELMRPKYFEDKRMPKPGTKNANAYK